MSSAVKRYENAALPVQRLPIAAPIPRAKPSPVTTRDLVQAAGRGESADGAFEVELRRLIDDGGPYPLLSAGSSGPVVLEVQRLLQSAGFDPGEVNGVLGPKTEVALKAFERARGLAHDGVAGKATLAELFQRRFSALGEQSQVQLLEQLKKLRSDSTARSVLSTVALAPGFRALSMPQQDALLRLLGGTSLQLSKPARDAVLKDFESGAFAQNQVQRQQQYLERLLRDEPALPELVEPSERRVRTISDFRILGPATASRHYFLSGTADALQFAVEVSGAKVPVYLPKLPRSEFRYHSVEQVAQGIAALPTASRALVTSINVEPKQNPNDARLRQRFGLPNFITYMLADAHGTVTIFPSTEAPTPQVLAATLVHETGHTLSRSLWGQDGDARWAPWQAAMERDVVHISAYAKASPAEDFSETLLAYHQVKGQPEEAELRALIPERFAFIEALLGE